MTQRAADTARTVTDSDRVKAATQRAADTARTVTDSDRVKAATQRAAEPTRRGLTLADRGARVVGLRRGQGRPAPAWAIVGGLLLSVAAVALTFRPWLAIDASNTAEALPGPDAAGLLGVTSFSFTTHQAFGVGTFLAAVVLLGAAAFLAGSVRRAGIWLVVASLLYLTGAALGFAIVGVITGAARAYRWLIPDSWEAYGPELDIGIDGQLFSLICLSMAIGSLWLWRHIRRPEVAVDPLPSDREPLRAPLPSAHGR